MYRRREPAADAAQLVANYQPRNIKQSQWLMVAPFVRETVPKLDPASEEHAGG